MKNKRSPISLKTLLIISFVILIVLSGISIAVISYTGSFSMGFSMASQIMEDNKVQVLNKVGNYLDNIVRINNTTTHLIDSAEIDKKKYYKHLLDVYPEIKGVYYGDEEGSFIFCKRMADNSVSFRDIKQVESMIHSNWEHENDDWFKNGFPNSVDTLEEGYDPRKRTWYKAAREAGKNRWSEVYIFSSDKLPGITNAVPHFNEKNYVRAVSGIDIGLIDISYYLNTLEISDLGKVVILDEKEQVIALSGNKSVIDEELRYLTSVSDYNNDVVREAYNYYKTNKFSKKLKGFSVNGQRFVTSFSDFNAENGIKWKVGIIIPEESILGRVNRTTRIIIFTALFFIIISIAISLWLANNISKPLKQISQNMRKVRKFELDENLVISTDLKELQEIDTSFNNLKNGMISFSKYVPSKVVARLVTLGKEAVLGGERRKLTVFFSDIEGFTEISENMEPEYLVEELADYLGALSRIIQENSGTVDKYIGDSIMSFWNAPDDVENHAALACNTALKIQLYIEDFKRNNPHRTFFPTRIGINTGDVLVGNIGSEDRMNYTVMGDNINLGSRLESLNKHYKTRILVSEETRKEVDESFCFRAIDKVIVKGKSSPVMLYELQGYSRYITKDAKEYNKRFEQGLDLYFKSCWDQAEEVLNECLKLRPDDFPCIEILKRINKYKQNPPGDDWEGVYIYLNK